MGIHQKIFVSAYACEPGLGSEIGVGWHWVLEMSCYFELWVLTRESNRPTIEPWIAEHPEYRGIHFLYFDLPKWARFWKKGLRGVRTYYNILLTANSNTILARKRELDEESIKNINDKIDYLCKKKGYRKVLNETTPQTAVCEILTYVFEEQHKKNLRRLK